jgi:hypothetical protein
LPDFHQPQHLSFVDKVGIRAADNAGSRINANSDALGKPTNSVDPVN